ncbi:MAG: hypothetical protein GXP17_08450 [Gammaproteobacteria bacterium]|nr:hypothetical protein [Gammaproteobacteria bacterium]
MKKLTVLLVLFFASTSAYAAEENWYAYWAIGLVEHDYPSELDSDLNQRESRPGVDRTKMGIDMLGFYWPLANNRLLGFVISGSGDRLSDSYGNSLQYNQYLYGISGMQFFGDEIGDGFYIRGDVGIAKVSRTIDTSFGEVSTSETGYGYLIGIGYGIPISDETRILLSVNFSDKQIDGGDWPIEDGSWRSTTFNVGGLW